MNYEQIADEILRIGNKRSAAYKKGLIRILKVRHEKHIGIRPYYTAPSAPCPYLIGTAEADAYYFGCERGHFEWQNNLHETHPSLFNSEKIA